MDKEKIDRIFKIWREKSLLTKKGALRAVPNFAYYLMIIVSNILFLLLVLSLIAGCVGAFFLAIKWLDAYNRVCAMVISPVAVLAFAYLLMRLFSTLFKSFLSLSVSRLYAVWTPIFYFFIDPLCSLFSKHKPILHFYEDRVVVSSGCIGHDKTYNYSDMERVVCTSSKGKDFRAHMLFKGMDRPIAVEGELVIGHLLYLFDTAFKPIFVNESLCEDSLRLFADMITMSRVPENQSKGLQIASLYFSAPKFDGYDYPRQLAEQVVLFNQYRARNRLPISEDYVSRSSSILRNPGVEYADRLELLSHLFECAYANDGLVDVVELDRLSRIAYYFRIKEWDFLSLKYSFEAMKQQGGRRNGTENAQQRERYQSAYSNRLKEAYKILGLSEKATLEEVKSAYRTQVKNCHPDTLPPTATDSEREEASIRFRTITEAYDFLCVVLAAEPVSVAR